MIKLNIVLLFCAVRTGHFGQGTFINSLIPYFKSCKNIQLSIVNTDDEKVKEVTWESKDGINMLSIPSPENNLYVAKDSSWIQKTYANRLTNIMEKYIGQKDNLIFWINSPDYLNLAHAIKSSIKCKILYVHHAWSWKHHKNIDEEYFAKMWKQKEVNFHPLAFQLTSYQYDLAVVSDLVITGTYHSKKFFEEVLDIEQSKISVIYNGVYNLYSAANKLELREKYGFKNKDKILLYVGRIVEDKGVKFLANAFRELAKEDKNVKMLFVGDGIISELTEIVSPYWARTIFTGEISKELVQEFYKIADVGIIPSLHEQGCFTAMEMRFAKLPIIVADFDGLRETFTDGFDCLKLDVFHDENRYRTLDPIDLKDKIKELLSNFRLRNSIVKNSYLVAEKCYDVKIMQKKYLAKLLELYN